MEFPLKLGEESLEQDTFDTLPLSEQQLIQRLSAFSLSQRFWEGYKQLRAHGFRTKDAAIGAWKAAGYKRGGKLTQDKFAEVLGISRRTIIRRLSNPALQDMAVALQMEWWHERVPAIDEALYARATGFYRENEKGELVYLPGEATAIKLAYQRARVAMSGEDAEPQDNWMQALEKARAEAATDSGNGLNGSDQGEGVQG